MDDFLIEQQIDEFENSSWWLCGMLNLEEEEEIIPEEYDDWMSEVYSR